MIPLGTDLLPPLAATLLPLGLIVGIGVLASWKQPTAVRKIRLRGKMWLPYIGGVLLLGLIGGLNAALYSDEGRWWLPPLTAVVLFALVWIGGRAMDRYWAREVSHSHPRQAVEQTPGILDPLFQSIERLQICALLEPVTEELIGRVKGPVGIDDQRFIEHVQVLINAGYLGPAGGGRPRRHLWLHLTAQGRAAFCQHAAALYAIAPDTGNGDDAESQ